MSRERATSHRPAAATHDAPEGARIGRGGFAGVGRGVVPSASSAAMATLERAMMMMAASIGPSSPSCTSTRTRIDSSPVPSMVVAIIENTAPVKRPIVVTSTSPSMPVKYNWRSNTVLTGAIESARRCVMA